MQRDIIGDWGSSRLRLALAQNGAVIDRRDGPGATAARGRHADILAELTHDWRTAHGALPVTLCGAVGAREGWAEAPYLPCPAAIKDIASLLHTPHGHSDVRIAPGMSWRGGDDVCDVMRGEETQILGALAIDPTLQHGRHIVCLPGTHTKWVEVIDAAVTRLRTVMTGEAFALLNQHSNLVGAVAALSPAPDAFAEGLRLALRAREANPLALAFQARAHRLLEARTPDWAHGFLSGALIGADVRTGRSLFDDAGEVTLIGAPALTAAFSAACSAFGLIARAMSGDACSEAGLMRLARQRV